MTVGNNGKGQFGVGDFGLYKTPKKTNFVYNLQFDSAQLNFKFFFFEDLNKK
jgi:hypothetical protein